MAYDLALPVAVAVYAESLCTSRIVPPGEASVTLCSLLDQAAYSVDAQDQLGSVFAFMIHAKPAVYRSVVLNPIFPLAGESVLIPKTDQQAQKP